MINKNISIICQCLTSAKIPHIVGGSSYIGLTTGELNKYTNNVTLYIFNYNPFNLSFGRDYMNNYNNLFFSDFSPSMDHFKLNYTKNNFDYNYLLIKLNNDLITDEDLDENKYINRWMYYRGKIHINIFQFFYNFFSYFSFPNSNNTSHFIFI